MANESVGKIVLRILVVMAIVLCVGFGIAFGIAIASVKNIIAVENFATFEPSLPSRLVDCEGRLITEFASNEKRELISLKDMPQHLIDALITREDRTFWTHPGFTLKGYFRAFIGLVTGNSLGGGSTITLQLAGTLYADRKDISVKRKLVELWWGLQLERRYTKQEILEMYMNRMIMGPGVYGVEAASKYFFGHSAKDVTIAEAAILVIQLSSPTRYNPIRNPNIARERSKEVIDQMVEFGYISKEEGDISFADYWDNYDYTRVATAAFYDRDDKAPWFSEYVRRQLEDMLYGSTNLYKDGLTIHTTLDLDYQESAEKYMSRYLKQVNEEYLSNNKKRLREAENLYAPMSELLGLAFNIEGIFFNATKIETKAMDYYRNNINPTVDALALMFGIEGLKPATSASYGKVKTELEKNTVEDALITIENDTGHIKAIVGGSKFDQSNQLIRATQAQLMPGSSFKPLFYSAAIDTRRFTASSLIYDAPIVFHSEDGTPYIPLNYKGEWNGPVLLYWALAKSLNVPSLKIMDSIGFTAAIDRASKLLDITDPEQIRKTFPRYFPLALGVIAISPLRMARAFSIFANDGREVSPIAVRTIEDRDGNIIMDIEKDLRTKQKEKGSDIQVISPQNAYIMREILKGTINFGTLAYPTSYGSIFSYKDENGKKYTIPSAGKTGTTQNWADAWAVGFTPYYTTAIWFGFDRPGNSLGVNQSGATIAGAAWARYMAEIHEGKAFKDFSAAPEGISELKVCSVSGLLPTEYCGKHTVTLPFLAGTEPKEACDLHKMATEQEENSIKVLAEQKDKLGDLSVDSTLDYDTEELDDLLLKLLTTEYEEESENTFQADEELEFIEENSLFNEDGQEIKSDADEETPTMTNSTPEESEFETILEPLQ